MGLTIIYVLEIHIRIEILGRNEEKEDVPS